MTDKARFLKKKNKKIGGSNVGSADLNQAQVEVFLEFGSFIFLEISYNNGLQQFLTFFYFLVEVKPTKNIFGAQIWAKWAKICPEISFFCYFLKFGSLVFLEIPYNDSLQQCLTSSGGKTHESKIWGQNCAQN